MYDEDDEDYEYDEDYGDDGFCNCGACHTIDEMNFGQCDCCGKPISCEEYS